MAVVLMAMGIYGAGYLGWQIRTATDGVSSQRGAPQLRRSCITQSCEQAEDMLFTPFSTAHTTAGRGG
jgi:hypothetical protein